MKNRTKKLGILLAGVLLMGSIAIPAQAETKNWSVYG